MSAKGCLVLCAALPILLAALFPILMSEVAGGWTAALPFRSKFDPNAMPNLQGKTALVTGANTGIGRTTALTLARAGAMVLVHGRTEARVAPVLAEIAAVGGKAESVLGDLAALKSIQPLAEKIVSSSGGRALDIVILNAGLCKDCMGQTDEGFELTGDGFELHIQVNHLAHQFLVEKLLAGNAISATTRLVSVSSALESRSYPEGIRYENWQAKGRNYTDGAAYGQSKLANVMMAREVHRRFGVQSVSVHPGIIASDLGRYVEQTPLGLVKYLFRSLFSFARMNVEQGSWTQLWAATAPGLEKGHFIPVGKEHAPSHPVAQSSGWDDACTSLWDRSHAVLKAFM